jgi:hypothetical protein
VRTDCGESGTLRWRDQTTKKGRGHFPVQHLVADCGRRCLPQPGDRVDGLGVPVSGRQVREFSQHQSLALQRADMMLEQEPRSGGKGVLLAHHHEEKNPCCTANRFSLSRCNVMKKVALT